MLMTVLEDVPVPVVYQCLHFFFFKWEPKTGDENCSMTLHMSMWINPAPQLQPMEMLIEMLLT